MIRLVVSIQSNMDPDPYERLEEIAAHQAIMIMNSWATMTLGMVVVSSVCQR